MFMLLESQQNVSKGAVMPRYIGGLRDLMSILMSDGERQRILQSVWWAVLRFAKR